MPPPVYSVRLFDTYGGAVSTSTLFTVPTGFVYVVRCVDAVKYAGASGELELQDVAAGGNLAWWDAGNTNAYKAWRGDQVFEAGQSLSAIFTLGSWRLYGSGFKLTA